MFAEDNGYVEPTFENADLTIQPTFENPESTTKSTFENHSPFCIARLKNDMQEIYQNPLPLIFIAPEEENITTIHSIICGPEGTPYEGGFFYFLIKVPEDYPLVPPNVMFMTTDCQNVRFNPNFYANGKVCLSILGTWPGPKWTAAQTIQSVLLSIQSLMNDTPLGNEPNLNIESMLLESNEYNNHIQHETIRVAVLNTLEGKVEMPPVLFAFAKSCFNENLKFYEDVIKANMHRDEELMKCFFQPNKIMKYKYKSLLERLQMLIKAKRSSR